MPRQNKDKLIIRLPDGWRGIIKEKAVRNRRSMNSEVLAALESVVEKATAGDEFGHQAPAVAGRTDALASVNSITNGNGSTADE